MERLERYLRKVGRALPRAGRDDILAELREALLSRIEERERRAGRRLTDGETDQVLRELGHPLAVAGGYSHPGGLIPAALVPFYRRVLEWTLVVIVSVHAALCLGRVFTEPSIGHAVARSLPGLLVAMLAAFTAITLAFMALGRHAADRVGPVCRPSP